MAFSRGLLFSCLTLLIATCVQSASIPTHQPICQNIPHGYGVGVGRGVEVNYHPYVVFGVKTDTKVMEYTVYGNGHPDKNCSFTLNFKKNADWYDAYQITADKVVISMGIDDDVEFIRVDMNTCTSILGGETFKKSEDKWKFKHLVIRADGADVIAKENDKMVKISYDIDDKQVGEPKAFELDADFIRMQAISPKSPSSNIIVYYKKGGNNFVSLVDANGKLIKHLMEAKSDVWNNPSDDVSDSLYAYCFDHESKHEHFDCGQVDETGNQKYKHSTHYDTNRIGVRNLKEGGVVLFTVNDKEIHVVEMRPAQVTEKSYPVENIAGNKYSLFDFNEVEGKFTIMTKHSATDKVCWQTYSFPSKSQ